MLNKRRFFSKTSSMEQQDYLTKQIDQLGQVLAKLLGDILGLKKQGKETESISLTNNILKNELGFNISEFVSMSKTTFLETLEQTHKLNNENLNSLANILLTLANTVTIIETKNIILERVLDIYNYMERKDKTYDPERNLSIDRIKKEIAG